MMNDTTTTTTTTTINNDNSSNNTGGCWIGIDIGTSNSSVAVYDRTRGSSKWIRLSKSIAICNNDNDITNSKLGRIVPSIIVIATEQYILENNTQHQQNSNNQNNTISTNNISPTTTTTTTYTTTTTIGTCTTSLTTEWYDVSHIIKPRMILTAATTTKKASLNSLNDTTGTTTSANTNTNTNSTIVPFDDSDNNNKLYACIGSAAIQLANFYNTTTTTATATVDDNTNSVSSTNTKQQSTTVSTTTVTTATATATATTNVTTVNDIEAATIRNFKRKIFLQNSETYTCDNNNNNNNSNNGTTCTDQYYPSSSDICIVPLGMKQQQHTNDDTSTSTSSTGSTTTTTTTAIVLVPIDAITILLYIIRIGSNEYLYNNIHKKQLQIPGMYPPCSNVTIGVPIKSSSISSNDKINNTIKVNNNNNKQNQQYRYLLTNSIGPLSGFTGTINTLSESTAAAMSYGLFTKLSSNTTTSTTATTTGSTTTTRQQQQQQEQPRLILVFDMGGGTTDVTIIQQQQQQQQEQQQDDDDDDDDSNVNNNNEMKSDYIVVATSGNNQLGGIDIDMALSTIVYNKIHDYHCRKENTNANNYEQEQTTNYHIVSSPSMVLELCKHAKEQLCSSDSNSSSNSSGTTSTVNTVDDHVNVTVTVTVTVQYTDNTTMTTPTTTTTTTTTNMQKYEKSIPITITHTEFMTAIQPIVRKAEAVVCDAISSLQQRQQQRQQQEQQPLVDDNNVINNDRMVNTTTPPTNQNQVITINEVVLVGGSSRVPAIRNMLRSFHKKQQEPQQNNISIQQEEKVVVVEEEHQQEQEIEQEQQFVFENELCLSINPMSAVAQGCAVHAAIVSKTIPYHELQSAMMLDTCSYPIGVLVVSDDEVSVNDNNDGSSIHSRRKQRSDVTESKFIEVISKDSTLPASNFETFQLANIHQKGVTIHAVEKILSDDWNGSGSIDEQQRQQQQEVQYNNLGEFTFLLHKLHTKQIQKAVYDGYRSIDVGMTLTQHGEFIVSIFDHNDPDHIIKLQNVMEDSSNITNVRIKKRLEEHYNTIRTTTSDLNGTTGSAVSENDTTTTTEQLLLLFACIGTFILYIYVKIMLSEDVNISSAKILQNDYTTNKIVVDTQTMQSEL